jgi:hypothetical protein
VSRGRRIRGKVRRREYRIRMKRSYGYTEKKKSRFFSYIRKFRVEQLQSHI